MKKQIIYLINIVAILFFVNTTRSQTLIPGSLPSELSVSPTGAAVYTIPIELPEGRGGMTPQLALQYNSSAGDGILGKGWGLSGWSYISRVAESEYFDGTVGSVDFVNDGFTLDGMRLIKVPNSNTFRTEIDEGSRITAYGFGKKDESLTNDYFVIETKSGLKKYFGATEGSDSRQYYRVYSNHPVRWHLDKVVDLSGNMILYYYDRDPTYGEIYLSKVEYSKNENSNALNNQLYTVKFEYQNIASQAFQLSTFLNFNADVYRYDVRKRLSTIKIEYGSNELISKYLINYTTGGIFENEYLSSVKNVSGDETSCFNPISFTWNYNVADDTEQKQTLIEEYIPFPGYPNLKITADVNGDGRADIIEAEPGGNKIQVIVNNGQYGGTKYIVDNFNPTKIWAGDFDGDGKDEVIAENSNGQIGLYKLFTHGFVKIGPYLSGNISFVGDFDGDGLYDVITKEGELRKFCAGRGSIYYLLDNSNRKNLSGLDNAAYWQGYFNGSPKMGIIKVVESELKHYLITPFDASSYTLTNTFNFDLSGMPYLIDFGDFNADGKDDLLSLFWDGSNYSTKINYAFGSGFTEIAYNMDINTFWGINYRISDLNNDGLSDIVFIANQYSVGEKLIVEYKKLLKKPGISGGFLTIQDQVEVQITGGTPSFQNYYVGDFNAIAEKDLLFQFHTEFSSKQVQESEQSNTTLKRLLFYSAETKLPEDNIIAITDGMNVTNMISYDTYRIDLSLESNYSYPVVVNRNPYTIINKIYFADSKRLQTSTLLKEFKFKNLIMHNQGKGVLGCMEMEMRDVANGLISITKNNLYLNASRNYFVYPYEIKTYGITNNGNALLSETYNTVSIRETIDNVPKIFIPVTTNSYTKSWDLDGTYKGIEMVKQDLWNVDEYGNLKMKEVLSDEYKTIPDEFNWKWQSQYWTFFDHVTDNGKWHSRLMGTVVKAKSYELDEWKFESTENKYYGNGLLEFIKSIAGYDQFSSPLVSKTNLEYDIYGNITKKTLSAPNDTQLPNRVTDYEYSSIYNGRFLTKQTVIGPPDVSTVYEYYADKGMLKEKKELYNASTNTSPIVTKYEYDSFGRLQKTTHPDQTMSFTEMTFAGTSGGEIPAGAVVKIKTYTKTLNNQTWATATRYLDKYGNQLRSIGQNLQGTNIYVDKTYDNYGRLVNETDPYYAGNPTSLTTTYAYDELGRVSTLTASNGTIMKTTYKGRAVKIKNMTSKVWTEKTINAIGLVDLIVDTLKTLNSADGINNNYDGLGRLINTVAFGNTSSFEYDAAGNQSKLIDPNAGTIIYSYNAYGELVTQKDARNNEYKMVYDKLGRIVSKILISVGSDSTTYTYLDNPSANGFTQLSSVSRNNGTMVSFTYDKLGRILKKNETVDQIIFTFAYTYNSNTGMLETYEYPSGYKLKYLYDSRGNQHEVRTGDAANTLLWKANSENQRGQLLQATLGNGAITDYGWDTYGYPQMNKVSKGSTILQNLTFSFNSVTGNLNTRTDVKRNILETFDYDNLLKNRLIYWSATGGTAKTMAYKANGNIEKKTDVSRALDGYKYESTKPHAVTKVVYPTTDFSSASNLQAIEYTAFNKVESIHQAITTPFSGAYDLSLTYNPNNERVKTVLLTQLGMKTPLNTTKHFLDNYEVEQMLPSTQKQLHYLHAGDGLFAIMVKQGSNETLYYIHKDYLGSITAISNSTGSLVESLSYDPWGRRRNPANYSDYNVTSTMFDRGYTGHEHLPQFGLINMNGRVYDPFLARFLSPDPFVQAPDYSQNYNRYSYAFNNPLKYTDPDGEWVHLVVGAIIGGVANWAMNGAEFNAKGLGFFGVGAVAGALAAGTGAGFGTLAAGSGSFGFMSATGLSTVGFGAGFASGAGAGLTSGLVTGTGNSLLLGNGFQQSLQNGVETGLWSSLGGGLLGGSLSGIRALSGGKDFLSGNGSGGKFGKIPSPSTVGINDKGFQSSLNSNGLRNQIDNLIEPELKSGIYGRVQGISEIRINAGLSEARALGIAGEEAVGVGAKIRIPSLTGTAKYRIPDILTSTTLGEVKNVGHQNLTRQLTDFHLYSQQTGRQFILYTRPNTTFSGPLQNLINNRIIINQSIPFR